MDKDAITTMVVREYSKGRTKNQIVRRLSEAGLAWSEAEQLVSEIERTHRGQISRRKLPTTVLFGVIAGVGVLAIAILMLIRFSSVWWTVPVLPENESLGWVVVPSYDMDRGAEFRAERGNTIVIDYDVDPEQGDLTIGVTHREGIIAVQSTTIARMNIKRKRQGQWTVPVPEDGRYRVNVWMHGFAGWRSVVRSVE